MNVQMDLEKMNVEADEELGDMSLELDQFVATREDQFKTMIQNPNKSSEEMEKLIVTFTLLQRLVNTVEAAEDESCEYYSPLFVKQAFSNTIYFTASDEEQNSIQGVQTEQSEHTESLCALCAIYGLQDYITRDHEKLCRFSLKNNPDLTRKSILLLCYNSKTSIMSEQIRFRRLMDRKMDDEVEYHKLLERENEDYRRQRNRIKSMIRDQPEMVLRMIEGPENKAFMTFALLVYHQVKSPAALVQSRALYVRIMVLVATVTLIGYFMMSKLM